MKHGVYVSQQATSLATPMVASSGIPFVIGTAPVQSAESPAAVGVPVVCETWAQAVEYCGYAADWESYTLCEFMYSHFQLFGCSPVVFCNLLDPDTMKESVAAASFAVSDHKATLTVDAIDNDSLVVQSADGSTTYTKDTDYTAYYNDDALVVALISDGACYDAAQLLIAYEQVTADSVTENTVATGLESIESCLTATGVIPDLICAPGFSGMETVAAAMAAKAEGINGLFPAKALIDLPCDADGALTYSAAATYKADHNMTDVTQILCWPMLKSGDDTFHMSTQLAGLLSQVDDSNNGCPYESSSNKAFVCSAAVLEDGTEVRLTLDNANTLNANGIVTALNFINGWTCWGNYTACYPSSSDPKDYFIPNSRMFGWVGNTVIRSFWKRLDEPMTPRFRESILDAVNIWLAGLVGYGYLLGARVEMLADENPSENLMAGIMKFHIYMTPPGPAQELDFVLEYDATYLSALTA